MSGSFINLARAWLGTLPKEWEPTPLRALLARQVTDGPHETPEFLSEGVPFLSVDGIQAGELVFKGCRYISDEAHRRYARKVQPKRDDILMGKAASTGKIARVKTDLEFNIWSPLAVLRPTEGIAPAYLEYSLKSSATQAQIEVLCTSNTQKNISMADIPRMILGVPPLPTQKAIADFLDKKTAAIDALIEKKQTLLTLLAEKRAALINQAVTKGLDPNVPMKDSGIPWIGEIPAHWEVKHLDMMIDPARRLTYGIVQAGPPVKEGRFMIRGGDYSTGWVSPEQILRVNAEVEVKYRRSRLRTDDIVLTIVGAGTGNVATVPAWLDGANLTQTTARLAPHPRKTNTAYLASMLQSPVGRTYSNIYQKGAAQPGLNLGHIAKWSVPSPPLEEQVVIAANVHAISGPINKVTEATVQQIAILQEYRQALITAAVTGQLDIGEAA